MRHRLSCCLLTAVLFASPAAAATQYGRLMGDQRTALVDPDEAVERMAATARPRQGAGETRLSRKTNGILRDDRYLREAFAGVGHH